MAPKKVDSCSSSLRRRLASSWSIRPAREVGVDRHLLAGHRVQGEARGHLGDARRAARHHHEVHDHQDREDDHADDEVAVHHQLAERLDDVAGAVGALVAVAEDQPGRGDVEPEAEQRRHQQHGREGGELQRLLDQQRGHQDQDRAGDRDRQQHVQHEGRDRQDQQDDDADDADGQRHLATRHPAPDLAGRGRPADDGGKRDVSHGAARRAGTWRRRGGRRRRSPRRAPPAWPPSALGQVAGDHDRAVRASRRRRCRWRCRARRCRSCRRRPSPSAGRRAGGARPVWQVVHPAAAAGREVIGPSVPPSSTARRSAGHRRGRRGVARIAGDGGVQRRLVAVEAALTVADAAHEAGPAGRAADRGEDQVGGGVVAHLDRCGAEVGERHAALLRRGPGSPARSLSRSASP